MIPCSGDAVGMSTNREIKSALYEQVARLAKAAASPKRLELLDLLCQAPKPVEELARAAGISNKLASAHLKGLREARLVTAERRGKQVFYRPASAEVPRFCLHLRLLAEERLEELQEHRVSWQQTAESGAVKSETPCCARPDPVKSSSSTCARRLNTTSTTCRLPARFPWTNCRSAWTICRETEQSSPTAGGRSA